MRRRSFIAGAVAVPLAARAQIPRLAFPGAQGWAAGTPGGRGGRIVRVTTLASDGPGSLREALATKGPRIVVFEVGGVIDLDRRNLKIAEPFLTIAGQTAPAPGVTLIRGGLTIATHDVVVRHICVRPGAAGQAKGSGWEVDALSTDKAQDVIVDHCSLTWATDEGLSASGPRFDGAASRRITFSNNIVAEGLSKATHSKGEHSKGTLVHDNSAQVLVIGNLYAHNRERNPLFKGGAEGAVVNNLIHDPGKRAIHYNLHAGEWEGHAFRVGRLSVVGNLVQAGPSTGPDVSIFMLGGEGDLELHAADNLAIPPLPAFGRFGKGSPKLIEVAKPTVWPAGLVARPVAMVKAAVLADAGARPWDRDPIDTRIVRQVAEGGGRIIDSEAEVGGYPSYAPSRRTFVEADWDLGDLTPRRPGLMG